MPQLVAPPHSLTPATEAEAAGVQASPPVDFRAVFDAHGAYVLGLIQRLGVPGAAAEDVAQEVFLAIHRGLPSFEGRSTLKTWICGITLRSVRNHRRKQARSLELPSERASMEPVAALQHRDLESRRALEVLQAALDELGEERREVFMLFEVEGLSMVEVAEATGASKFTAYTRLYAARKHVRQAFKRAGLGGSP